MSGMRTLIVLGLMLHVVSAAADDWPQWMGPKRDNVWRETGIVEKFPEGGPKILWRQEIGGGYAGPAVANGKVVITDYVSESDVKVDNFARKEFTGEERVHCLDEATGKILWTHKYPVKYTISYPAGPRCTPNFDGDRVYVLGAEGDLFCFNVADGAVVWSKDLKKAYGAQGGTLGLLGSSADRWRQVALPCRWARQPCRCFQ